MGLVEVGGVGDALPRCDTCGAELVIPPGSGVHGPWLVCPECGLTKQAEDGSFVADWRQRQTSAPMSPIYLETSEAYPFKHLHSKNGADCRGNQYTFRHQYRVNSHISGHGKTLLKLLYLIRRYSGRPYVTRVVVETALIKARKRLGETWKQGCNAPRLEVLAEACIEGALQDHGLPPLAARHTSNVFKLMDNSSRLEKTKRYIVGFASAVEQDILARALEMAGKLESRLVASGAHPLTAAMLALYIVGDGKHSADRLAEIARERFGCGNSEAVRNLLRKCLPEIAKERGLMRWAVTHTLLR